MAFSTFIAKILSPNYCFASPSKRCWLAMGLHRFFLRGVGEAKFRIFMAFMRFLWVLHLLKGQAIYPLLWFSLNQWRLV